MTVIAKRALGTKGDLWAHVTEHAERECGLLLLVNALPPLVGTSGPVSALLSVEDSSLCTLLTPSCRVLALFLPRCPGWESLGPGRMDSALGFGEDPPPWGRVGGVCAPVGDQPGVGICWPG